MGWHRSVCCRDAGLQNILAVKLSGGDYNVSAGSGTLFSYTRTASNTV